ncbi:hypothetical protein ONE63_011523 [Megalurothrips usitatus]|uniref:Uncharacterized protein n=1 Tax=Megalurothrips usitatus TaxID=439358 RepID=A0AAV7WZR9_9NEOP|nr:hypothetical protein ONE63_011523 [Megalurothrips usitatus]
MATCWPVLESGCCCTLETCCKVQGWLNILFANLGIVAMVVLIIWYSGQRPVDLDPDLLIGCAAAGVLLYVLILVISILFLVGISKRRPALLIPYVIKIHLGVFALVAGGIVEASMSGNVVRSLVQSGLEVAPACYMMLCANSLLVKMRAELSATAAESPREELGVEPVSARCARQPGTKRALKSSPARPDVIGLVQTQTVQHISQKN